MAEDVELRQGHVRRHLDGAVPAVPGVPHVRHGVAEALNLDGTHLDVEGKVSQVHRTGRLDSESHASQYLSWLKSHMSSLSSSYKTCVHDPQELVLCGG